MLLFNVFFVVILRLLLLEFGGMRKYRYGFRRLVVGNEIVLVSNRFIKLCFFMLGMCLGVVVVVCILMVLFFFVIVCLGVGIIIR